VTHNGPPDPNGCLKIQFFKEQIIITKHKLGFKLTPGDWQI